MNSKLCEDRSERLKKATSIPCLGTSSTSGDDILAFLKYLTLKAPAKNASENVVCFSQLRHVLLTLLTNVCMEVNSVDPDQTAPTGAV